MPGRVIDVSSAQHPNGAPINWPTVAKAGVTTAIIKATQGTNYVNPYFHADLAGALAAGLQVMAYHYADFGSAQLEAEFFLGTAGHLAQALDIETSSDVPWARTFLQALGRPADELLVYGSASSLVSIYAQLPAMAWVAAYQSHSPGWGVLWQFTDAATIPGIPAAVDQDAWQGSEIQYDQLFGIYDPPTGGDTMLASTPTGAGYWRLSASGAIVTYGDAEYLGGPNTSNTGTAQAPNWNGPPNLIPGHVCVTLTAHPLTQGYWIEDNAGNLYAYGAAPQYASPN